MDADLAPFLANLRKLRILFWVMAVVGVAMGVGLFFIPRDYSMSAQKDLLMRVGGGAGMVVCGVSLAVMALRPPERQAPILMLLERAADIVWIFPTVHMRYGVHVRTSYTFCLIDGRKTRLAVTPRDEAAAVAALRQRCPHARFGYDRDWERLFKTNPAALRS